MHRPFEVALSLAAALGVHEHRTLSGAVPVTDKVRLSGHEVPTELCRLACEKAVQCLPARPDQLCVCLADVQSQSMNRLENFACTKTDLACCVFDEEQVRRIAGEVHLPHPRVDLQLFIHKRGQSFQAHLHVTLLPSGEVDAQQLVQSRLHLSPVALCHAWSAQAVVAVSRDEITQHTGKSYVVSPYADQESVDGPARRSATALFQLARAHEVAFPPLRQDKAVDNARTAAGEGGKDDIVEHEVLTTQPARGPRLAEDSLQGYRRQGGASVE